jgi:hypothetical protein
VLRFKEFEKIGSDDRNAYHNNKIIIAGELAIRGKRKESLDIVSQFSNPKNRVKAYSKLAVICQRNQVPHEAKYYLDSAFAEVGRLRNFNGNFMQPLIEALTRQNNSKSERQALEYVGSTEWANRAGGLHRMMWGYASIDEYYKSWKTIPPLASAGDKLFLYDWILTREYLKPEYSSNEWKLFDQASYGVTDFNFFANDLISN